MNKKNARKNFRPDLTHRQGQEQQKLVIKKGKLKITNLPSILQPEKNLKEKAVGLVKERFDLREVIKEKIEDDSEKKPFVFGSFCQKYLRPDSMYPEQTGLFSSKLIYVFQDQLADYLKSIEHEFLLQVGKRKKQKLLGAGLDFFRRVNQDKNFKPDTMLIAAFLWHKLYHSGSVADCMLEKYMVACLWIACKQEEYYPVRSQSLCGYYETFKLTKMGTKCFNILTLNVQGLLESEQEVLTLNKFKIVTPPFFSLLHIFEAEIFPERKSSYTRLVNSILEAAYYRAELFTFPITILVLAALSKIAEDKDEERNCRVIKRYLLEKTVGTPAQFEKATSFLTEAVEERRKERMAILFSSTGEQVN